MNRGPLRELQQNRVMGQCFQRDPLAKRLGDLQQFNDPAASRLHLPSQDQTRQQLPLRNSLRTVVMRIRLHVLAAQAHRQRTDLQHYVASAFCAHGRLLAR